MIRLAAHPLLDAVAFESEFPSELGAIAVPEPLAALLRPGAAAPLASDDDVRRHVRDLLRHGGYRPTGRGKPASEYLLGALEKGSFPSINVAVDSCNAASLHSGLPISVIDLGLSRAPLSIAIQPEGASYAFNPTGQTIDLAGLVCLCDADGPCANAVKDAQRTKTGPGTLRTLSVVWGTSALPGRAERTARWYRELLEGCGARTAPVDLERAG